MNGYLQRLVEPAAVDTAPLKPSMPSRSPLAEHDQRLHNSGLVDPFDVGGAQLGLGTLEPGELAEPSRVAPSSHAEPALARLAAPAVARTARATVQRFVVAAQATPPAAPSLAPSPAALPWQLPSFGAADAEPAPRAVAPALAPLAAPVPAAAPSRAGAPPLPPVLERRPSMLVRLPPVPAPETRSISLEDEPARPPTVTTRDAAPEELSPLEGLRERSTESALPGERHARPATADALEDTPRSAASLLPLAEYERPEAPRAPEPPPRTVVVREEVRVREAPVPEAPRAVQPKAPKTAAEASVIGPLASHDRARARWDLWAR